MGLLDGGAASIFGSLMGAYFLPATLHKAGEMVYSGASISMTPDDIPCKAQVDAATYAMHQSANYIDGDSRILVLADSVTTDDEITVQGRRYKVYAVARDPAGAYWDCAARNG